MLEDRCIHGVGPAGARSPDLWAVAGPSLVADRFERVFAAAAVIALRQRRDRCAAADGDGRGCWYGARKWRVRRRSRATGGAGSVSRSGIAKRIWLHRVTFGPDKHESSRATATAVSWAGRSGIRSSRTCAPDCRTRRRAEEPRSPSRQTTIAPHHRTAPDAMVERCPGATAQRERADSFALQCWRPAHRRR